MVMLSKDHAFILLNLYYKERSPMLVIGVEL